MFVPQPLVQNLNRTSKHQRINRFQMVMRLLHYLSLKTLNFLVFPFEFLLSLILHLYLLRPSHQQP